MFSYLLAWVPVSVSSFWLREAWAAFWLCRGYWEVHDIGLLSRECKADTVAGWPSNRGDVRVSGLLCYCYRPALLETCRSGCGSQLTWPRFVVRTNACSALYQMLPARARYHALDAEDAAMYCKTVDR
ncbi:hypothetical protein GE09DRAFT_757325 [Coniochaeta sp. 2T2.1]|nr:hypothetical protein GE09DRAFT_757325 [Coniochaeta sp. 2T2.1]